MTKARNKYQNKNEKETWTFNNIFFNLWFFFKSYPLFLVVISALIGDWNLIGTELRTF